MIFRDWCLKQYGIVGFAEAKINKVVFLPALTKAILNLDNHLVSLGAVIVDDPLVRGITIAFDAYNLIHPQLPLQLTLAEWRIQYFRERGVDASQLYEYNEPANIHIIFDDIRNRHLFVRHFNLHSQKIVFNPIVKRAVLECHCFILNQLKLMYYQHSLLETATPPMVTLIYQQLETLKALQENIGKNNLSSRLDEAKLLAKDYSNMGLELHHAASAYAMSLKVYAEVNRDILSEHEYCALNTAAALLAAYDDKGFLKQSLKTDSKFVVWLVNVYHQHVPRGEPVFPLLGSLPEPVKNKMLQAIDNNISLMLYGISSIAFENGNSFKMRRFLPDANMESETNELIFQGGGTHLHSAIFRLVKVGIMADGSLAAPGQKPLFFRYYKVVDDLGANAKGVDKLNKTCIGTYITEMHPTAAANGILSSFPINPFICPAQYQSAMEFTIIQTILIERLLWLYRIPGSDPVFCSRPGSTEAMEWLRLDQLRHLLAGAPCNQPVIYFSRHPLDSRQMYRQELINRVDYYQEGGSCTIFSPRSMVRSVIGITLATEHNNFMQLFGAKGHLEILANKCHILTEQLKRMQSQTALSILNNTFFEKENPTIRAFRASPLKNLRLIQKISAYNDPHYPQVKLLKLSCATLKNASSLADSLTKTAEFSIKVKIIQNEVIVEESSFATLCNHLHLPLKKVLAAAPKEEEDDSSNVPPLTT